MPKKKKKKASTKAPAAPTKPPAVGATGQLPVPEPAEAPKVTRRDPIIAEVFVEKFMETWADDGTMRDFAVALSLDPEKEVPALSRRASAYRKKGVTLPSLRRSGSTSLNVKGLNELIEQFEEVDEGNGSDAAPPAPPGPPEPPTEGQVEEGTDAEVN